MRRPRHWPARSSASVRYTRAVGKACHDLGLPLLPGVATGSEIMMAQEDGLTELKFFRRAGGRPRDAKVGKGHSAT
jgi:2-dehydro-3-deoxyphosphogluconate aldolase/(4S)-4-hydroxy-2-oxoglutarate aldolase